MSRFVLPRSNTGAAIGAFLAAVLLALVQFAVNYVATGQAFPMTGEGWVRLTVTALGGAILSAAFPRYSLTEQREGYRPVRTPPDAPVVQAGPDGEPAVIGAKPPSP